MMKLLKNRWLLALIGALGGFLYWKYIGCTSGTCAIRQSWQLSTLWGASLGWLVSGLFGGSCCGGGSSCEIPSNNKTNDSRKINNNNQEE